MSYNIIVEESFEDEDLNILDNVSKNDFESSETFNLRLAAEELSKDTSIDRLISYEEVKKNLDYDLPHQSEGALRILRDMNGTALLADEVGLGKTVTAGTVLKECIARGFVKKALILTPPSLVDQWVSELKDKFNLNFSILEDKEDWDNVDFAIASIDRVKNYDRELKQFRHANAHGIVWDLLIVDEAHKLKEKNTIRWKFVDKLQRKRFLVLTATPFQNDLLELYSLLHLLKRGHLGTLKEFKKKFLNRGNKRYPLNPRDLKKKLDELMVRRRRDETNVTYMKRIPKIEAVKLSAEEYGIYERICELLKKQYLAADGSELNGKLAIYGLLPKITSSSRSAIESLIKMSENERYHPETRRIAREIAEDYKKISKDSKVERLVKIIKKEYEQGNGIKSLIYTKHPTTLDYLVEKLEPLGLSIVRFTGGLDREEKTRRIVEFKENADIMISTETGSEGLNFQFCSVLINYDLPWNPMAVEQRIGRLDRIGQKRDMKIYSLATKDTMEEYVVDLIINKMCCVGLVIGELPIILFNLGLDGEGKSGGAKFEEMLMNCFIDSKNNLDIFASEVHKISEIVEKGIGEYKKANTNASEVLDGE